MLLSIVIDLPFSNSLVLSLINLDGLQCLFNFSQCYVYQLDTFLMVQFWHIPQQPFHLCQKRAYLEILDWILSVSDMAFY